MTSYFSSSSSNSFATYCAEMDKYCVECVTFAAYHSGMDEYCALSGRADLAAQYAAEVKSDWVTYRAAYAAYRAAMDAYYAAEVSKDYFKVKEAYDVTYVAYHAAMNAYYASAAEKVVAEKFAASTAANRFAYENALFASAPKVASCLVSTKRKRRNENSNPSKRVCFQL